MQESRTPRQSSLFTASLILAACSFSQAAEVTSEPTVMDEIVVSASRVPEKKQEVTSNVTVISREDIDRAVGRNIGDLLAEKGVGHIQKYPGSLTAIGLRGFRTDTHGNDLQGHVLILLDGRRAGTGNVAKLLTENVERIEIIRGPGAVQYGSGGMGGVVNIITRQGNTNSLALEAGGGSFERGQFVLGGTAKKTLFDFAGSASGRTVGDYTTGSGQTYANTGYESETGLSANLGYQPVPGQRLGLVVTAFDTREAGSPDYLTTNDLDDYGDKATLSFDTSYTGKDVGGRWQWLARYFFGRDENTWHDPVASDPDGWDNGLSSGNTTDQQGAQAQISGEFGHSSLTAGLDWLHYQVENSWSPRDTGYLNPAAFLLGKSGLFERQLILTGGLRYDWYDVEVNDGQGRDASDTHLTPQAGAVWLLTDEVRLRGQYAQAFVMPSADQLALDMHSLGHRTVGNPDLEPEESETWEAGVEYTASGLAASLTGFSSHFQDKIMTTALADGSTSWQNLGEATIEGFEFSAGYDIGLLFDWQWEVRPFVDLTWLTTFTDDATGRDLPYVSAEILSAGLAVSSGEGATAQLTVNANGPQDVQDWLSGIYPAPTIELDGFTVTNLSLNYRLMQLRHGDLVLRGEVGNVFDEEYAYVNGYPMPGRSLYLGLKWNY